MTIAACFLTDEGVVFGADSTTTFTSAGYSDQHFNYSQKVFEIGEHGTLGMVMWGMGGFPELSYRTVIARLADSLDQKPATSVAEVATRWSGMFGTLYDSYFASERVEFVKLLANTNRTPAENSELMGLYYSHVGGFCLGGHLGPDRLPEAYCVEYDIGNGANSPVKLPFGQRFWGVPNMINRILLGYDDDLLDEIIKSGKWTGTLPELQAIAKRFALPVPVLLPLREAIDHIHASIFTTIKAMKLSLLNPVCGGPIEIAVISTDRHFRWVHHKSLGEATK